MTRPVRPDLTAGQSFGSVDLVISGARLVATCDDEARELPGGWVAVTEGAISAVGSSSETPPPATRTVDATDCLVTPGLVNTHHHLFQNLTRAWAPVVNQNLFSWLTGLYPRWTAVDEEASYLAAWVGLVELALGGCTTSSDHLYIGPRGGGDLWSAEITAAAEVGMRFAPTRGSMTVSEKDGGLPPDDLVEDADDVLADCERIVARHHDPSPLSMVRVGLGPCAPFNVSERLMRETADLAERLDVRLHTHLAEDPQDEEYCLARYGRRPVDQFAEVGWLGPRAWVAHGIHFSDTEVMRLGLAGVGVAHCPSSNMILGGGGICRVSDLRVAGTAVGLGCDGSASNDIASLWLEARTALLLARQRSGPTGMTARQVLEIATRGGAACLGRIGEIGQLTPGAAGDVVVWDQTGPGFAGAVSDPVEAWLRCGPSAARETIVAGRVLVENGRAVHSALDEILLRHAAVSRRLQQL